jgi:hypothetical protein
MKTWHELMALHDKYFSPHEANDEINQAEVEMGRAGFAEWWANWGRNQSEDFRQWASEGVAFQVYLQETEKDVEVTYMRSFLRNVYYWATLGEVPDISDEETRHDKKILDHILSAVQTEIEKTKEEAEVNGWFGHAVQTERDKLWVSALMLRTGIMTSFHNYANVPTVKGLLLHAGYGWGDDWEQKHLAEVEKDRKYDTQ